MQTEDKALAMSPQKVGKSRMRHAVCNSLKIERSFSELRLDDFHSLTCLHQTWCRSLVSTRDALQNCLHLPLGTQGFFVGMAEIALPLPHDMIRYGMAKPISEEDS